MQALEGRGTYLIFLVYINMYRRYNNPMLKCQILTELDAMLNLDANISAQG